MHGNMNLKFMESKDSPNAIYTVLNTHPSSIHLMYETSEFTYINLSKAKRRPLYLKTQSVPRSKNFSSGL